MNPTTAALAQARIDDMHRQACRSRFADTIRELRARRRQASAQQRADFNFRLLSDGTGLFRHV